LWLVYILPVEDVAVTDVADHYSNNPNRMTIITKTSSTRRITVTTTIIDGTVMKCLITTFAAFYKARATTLAWQHLPKFMTVAFAGF
jgi:hypothetical protein